LYGSKDDSVLISPESGKTGVYLWTVPYQEKYLAYYVGETGKSFAHRTMQHTQYYLNGFYRVYDPKEFVKGSKSLIWGGMWKTGRKGPDTMLEFLNQYTELSTEIDKFLKAFRIFLAPLDSERRIRQRIEAAINSRLCEQPGIVGSFQDKDIKYLPKRADEDAILVRINSHEPILGLANELTA
jgi:hypothetical protein